MIIQRAAQKPIGRASVSNGALLKVRILALDNILASVRSENGRR